jgi:hypothetical protein
MNHSIDGYDDVDGRRREEVGLEWKVRSGCEGPK